MIKAGLMRRRTTAMSASSDLELGREPITSGIQDPIDDQGPELNMET